MIGAIKPGQVTTSLLPRTCTCQASGDARGRQRARRSAPSRTTALGPSPNHARSLRAPRTTASRPLQCWAFALPIAQMHSPFHCMRPWREQWPMRRTSCTWRGRQWAIVGDTPHVLPPNVLILQAGFPLWTLRRTSAERGSPGVMRGLTIRGWPSDHIAPAVIDGGFAPAGRPPGNRGVAGGRAASRLVLHRASHRPCH
jgi:hypothetical protein